MRFLHLLFGFMDSASLDGGAAGGSAAAAADPAPAANTPDPATPASTPDPAATPEAQPTLADLEAAMQAGFGDDPQQTPGPNAQTQAIPAEFQQATQLSPFVTDANGVLQAVRAADEVWKVAMGQAPARTLLEGFKTANPQGFQAAIADLIPYIEQQTGQKFGGAPAQSPLDALKASNPQAYQTLAQQFQQATGMTLDGPTDPREARLQEIERRFAEQEQARQQQVLQEQQAQANEASYEFLGSKLKGTFLEGEEANLAPMLSAELARDPQAMEKILRGDTSALDKALKSVQKAEVERLKRYNERLVKNYRTLKTAVPGTAAKDGTAPAQQNGEFPPYQPGETPVAYAKRISGLK